MKQAGSSYYSFVVCFIVPFIVKCSTANKNAAESEEKRENYSVSSPHKHSSFKRKDSQKTRRDGRLLQAGLIVGE